MRGAKLPFTESGYVTIPVRIRERYLTPGASTAVVQAVGTHLMAAVPSDRDNLLLFLPFEEWVQSRAYERSMSRGSIHVAKWGDKLRTITEEGKRLIEALVRTTDLEIRAYLEDCQA